MKQKKKTQIIQPVHENKKLVLEFYPAHNHPRLDDTYFVLFTITGQKIDHQFGYAQFQDGAWMVPDDRCIVNQWCILPSGKLLL